MCPLLVNGEDKEVFDSVLLQFVCRRPAGLPVSSPSPIFSNIEVFEKVEVTHVGARGALVLVHKPLPFGARVRVKVRVALGLQVLQLPVDRVPVCHLAALCSRLPDQEFLLSVFKRERRHHKEPPLMQVQEKDPAMLLIQLGPPS